MKRQDVEKKMLDPGEAVSFDEELLGQGLRILAQMIARSYVECQSESRGKENQRKSELEKVDGEQKDKH